MIHSTQNKHVKQWRKLHKRKYRHEKGLFLVEGEHLVYEALQSNWQVMALIVQENIDIHNEWMEKSIPLYRVTEQVFQTISQTESPQGMAALVQIKEQSSSLGNRILLMDRVQDPGNVGTMIRTADAAGFTSIICGTGTVDLYNDKVLRATQGSLFHVQTGQEDLFQAIDRLKAENYTIVAADLSHQSISYKDVHVPEKIALIVGNEGTGISTKILEHVDHVVHIPMYGQAESLNVSIAAGILMYHFYK